MRTLSDKVTYRRQLVLENPLKRFRDSFMKHKHEFALHSLVIIVVIISIYNVNRTSSTEFSMQAPLTACDVQNGVVIFFDSIAILFGWNFRMELLFSSIPLLSSSVGTCTLARLH